MSRGQKSFPGDMTDGLVVSARVLNIAGEKKRWYWGWEGRRSRYLRIS